MGQVILVRPASRDAHWLLNLRINNQKRRINVCFNKIEKLYNQSRFGNIIAILEVYKWYQAARQAEGYYDKEIARLTKLVRRKVKDRIDYQAYSNDTYQLSVTNPISATLYRIINKFDTLMCLSETCVTLLIFKKRRLFANKTDQYKKSILRVITQISQYKIQKDAVLETLSDQDKERLSIAIHSDVMPLFADDLFEQLKQLVGKEIGTVTEEENSKGEEKEATEEVEEELDE